MPELVELLQYLIAVGGEDLHLRAGAQPHARVDGQLQEAPFAVLDSATVEAFARELMPTARAEEFAATGDADFAHSLAGLGRFRVSVFRQRGSVAMVARHVRPSVHSLDELGLPVVVERLAAETHGLVVVTGPGGAGKTTTVNAIVGRINETRAAHIITIEDPIEMVHTDALAMISQREVGRDTASYAEGARRALRQGPDVLVVAEVRDVETLAAVLVAAESGQLVVTTMGTTTAAETITRMIDHFPMSQHRQARHSLAAALRAVVAQRLLERADRKGRTAAIEVLVNTQRAYDCIVDPDGQAALARVLAEGQYHGMQTFDQSLLQLYKDGLVSFRDALAVSSQPEDLRIAMQQAGLGAGY